MPGNLRLVTVGRDAGKFVQATAPKPPGPELSSATASVLRGPLPQRGLGPQPVGPQSLGCLRSSEVLGLPHDRGLARMTAHRGDGLCGKQGGQCS